MGAPSKKPLSDHVMGAPSKKPLSDHVMGAPSKKPLSDQVMGARLIKLALVLALAFSAQAALAKKTAKKSAHGAIALQSESGQLGYAYAADSARAAKVEALNQCGNARCEVVLSFNNACGALARGPKKYFTATGATRQEAETKALRQCADNSCTVAAWACTK